MTSLRTQHSEPVVLCILCPAGCQCLLCGSAETAFKRGSLPRQAQGQMQVGNLTEAAQYTDLSAAMPAAYSGRPKTPAGKGHVSGSLLSCVRGSGQRCARGWELGLLRGDVPWGRAGGPSGWTLSCT